MLCIAVSQLLETKHDSGVIRMGVE